jgi:glutaredoxin
VARVTLYTREGCPSCTALRDELALSSDTLDEINLTAHPEAIPELLKLTRGRRIVPVVVRAGRVEIAPRGGSEF